MPSGRSFLWERDRSRPLAAYPRRLDRGGPPLAAYLALLQPGFTLPRLLPDVRWALTPPFHPYRPDLRPAVYFLWHFPSPATREWPTPRRYLAACPVEPGLSSRSTRPRATVQPIVPTGNITLRGHQLPRRTVIIGNVVISRRVCGRMTETTPLLTESRKVLTDSHRAGSYPPLHC